MNDHHLRSATPDDHAKLFELLALPPVYEFLADGVAPPPAAVSEWLSAAEAAPEPLGLWLLVDAGDAVLGCVRLSPVADGAASAELTYLLHPSLWGRGLATAMSRSVLARAFRTPTCDSILAGADLPNARSVAVMQRLGMQHLRDVAYAAGPGVEYVLTRERHAVLPEHASLAFAEG